MSVLSGGWLLAFGFSPGPAEMLLLAVVALLLYGGRLPEVAREWGKSFTEFRRGLSGIQNEINDVIYSEPDRLEYHEPEYQEHEYQDHDHDTSHGISDEASSESPSEESPEAASEESSEVLKTDDSPTN